MRKVPMLIALSCFIVLAASLWAHRRLQPGHRAGHFPKAWLLLWLCPQTCGENCI